jgi:hypothetical protein
MQAHHDEAVLRQARNAHRSVATCNRTHEQIAWLQRAHARRTARVSGEKDDTPSPPVSRPAVSAGYQHVHTIPMVSAGHQGPALSEAFGGMTEETCNLGLEEMMDGNWNDRQCQLIDRSCSFGFGDHCECDDCMMWADRGMLDDTLPLHQPPCPICGYFYVTPGHICPCVRDRTRSQSPVSPQYSDTTATTSSNSSYMLEHEIDDDGNGSPVYTSSETSERRFNRRHYGTDTYPGAGPVPHPEVVSQCDQDSEAESNVTPVLLDADLTCAAEGLAEQGDVFASSFDELCPAHQLLWSAYCVGLEGTITVDQVEFSIPNLFCEKLICIWNTDCSPGSHILFSRTRPALLRQIHQESEPAANVSDVPPVLLAMPMIEVAMFSATGAPAAYIDSGASMNISPDERLFRGTL